METDDKVTRSQALLTRLTAKELEFVRAVVTGKSQRETTSHLMLTHPEALSIRQSVIRKLEAGVTADIVRIGVYAGL